MPIRFCRGSPQSPVQLGGTHAREHTGGRSGRSRERERAGAATRSLTVAALTNAIFRERGHFVSEGQAAEPCLSLGQTGPGS